MRRRSFIGSAVSAPPGAVDKTAATVGHICISNGTDIWFISLSNWQSYSGTEYQAIGVVISSVGACNDDLVRVCSIPYMNCDTPDVGSMDVQYMPWNGINTIIGGGITETTDTNVAIADYNGKKNTTAILAKATDQPDWRTDPTITIYTGRSTNAYFPPACCCWRFHTLGTNQGDWYLPACGELHNVYQNITAIQTSLQVLGMRTAFDSYHWSSTSYGNSVAWRVVLNYPYPTIGSRAENFYVHAFLAL